MHVCCIQAHIKSHYNFVYNISNYTQSKLHICAKNITRLKEQTTTLVVPKKFKSWQKADDLKLQVMAEGRVLLS
jgi:hypothetical protein